MGRIMSSLSEAPELEPVFLKSEPSEMVLADLAREHHGTVIGDRGDGSQVTLWEHKIPVSGAENVINLRPCLRLTGADPSKPPTVQPEFRDLNCVENCPEGVKQPPVSTAFVLSLTYEIEVPQQQPRR